MKFPRPKSLGGLLLVALVLVVVPLFIAIIRVVVELDRLADQSEALVLQGVQASRDSQLLLEQIPDLERSARVYQVLGDDDLLTAYQDRHGRVMAALDEFSAGAEQKDAIGRRIELLRQDARMIAGTLGAYPPDSDVVIEALGRFDRLEEHARAIAAVSRQTIADALADLQTNVEGAQTTLAWQTAFMVPLTLVLVGLFYLLVLRPIRRLDRAISQLGEGTFSRPISVSGPQDLQALGEQLEWLRIRLLELAREKNRFLRHMSHELKTPLANIREGSELLMDGSVGDLTSPQREVAGILRENSLRLHKLIENLLSFSAWQARSARLEISDVSLRRAVESVVRQHRLGMASQGIRLDMDLEETEVEADVEKIKLVLDNLVSNAVKFTPPGGVIHVGSRADARFVTIDVADSGPGIAKGDRDRIFEAFYQGKTASGGLVRGTGIGLSVVRECVTAHGGGIELVDGEFEGAHFRVTLPRYQADAAA